MPKLKNAILNDFKAMLVVDHSVRPSFWSLGELRYIIYQGIKAIFRVKVMGFLCSSECLLKSLFSIQGPSGRPKFIRERLSTSSTSLSLVWAPPPPSTLNAEFRGYQLTYKPTNYITQNTTQLHISVKDPISIQVRQQTTLLCIGYSENVSM